MNIKEIALNLENIETIRIPAKYILSFTASDNTKIVHSTKDYLREIEVFNKISMIISNEVKEFENHESWMTEHGYEELNDYIFNRKDIVSISIVYEDETEKSIHANWITTNDFINENQYNYMSEDGDILIAVGLDEYEREKEKETLNDLDYLKLLK